MAKTTTKVRAVEYWLTPASGTSPGQILQVLDFVPPARTRPEEDTTCHEDSVSDIELGLGTWSTGSMTILFNPSSTVHKRIRDLCKTDSDYVHIAKGYGDGTADPTITTLADGFVFADTRTFMHIKCQLTNWRESGAPGANTQATFDIRPTGTIATETEPVVYSDKA